MASELPGATYIAEKLQLFPDVSRVNLDFVEHVTRDVNNLKNYFFP